MDGWRELPEHLLDSILERLRSSIDYLQFGAVCSSWNEIMKFLDLKRTEYNAHQVPMLLLPDNEEGSLQLYNAIQRKFLKVRPNIKHKSRFCGFSRGWLAAVNEDYTMTLYKPCFGAEDVSSSTISLPQLFPAQLEYIFDEPNPLADMPCEYHVHRFCITADPDQHDRECIIFVIYGIDRELAHIKYGKDRAWSSAPGGLEDILWHNNRLYHVDCNGDLSSHEYLGKGSMYELVEAQNYDNVPNIERLYLSTTPEGEIMLINRNLGYHGSDNIRKTSSFNVYKVNSHLGKWEKMRKLGDMTLFIGDNSAISVRASDFVGCCRNSIYFTQDDEVGTSPDILPITDVGIYNHETKELEFGLGIDQESLVKMINLPPIWIIL